MEENKYCAKTMHPNTLRCHVVNAFGLMRNEKCQKHVVVRKACAEYTVQCIMYKRWYSTYARFAGFKESVSFLFFTLLVMHQTDCINKVTAKGVRVR